MNTPPASPSESDGDARQRLLELRRRQRSAAAETGAIPRRSHSAPIPLSSAQEGLWLLDQLTGPSPIYSIVRAVRLHGGLDVAALERSLQTLVERHESLRTGVASREGSAVQVVQEAAEATAFLLLVPEQAPGRSLAAREETIEGWLRAGAAEPFDLARPPLLRVRLLRLDDQEHVLLLVMHHIVADGWSMDILARELDALYAAFSAGRSDPLAALPIQFSDYAVWQRQRLEGPSAEGDLAYWREQLKELPVLQLPTDRARPARLTHEGAVEPLEIEPALLAELRALARREKVTLFMVLLAAFQVLLMRYSGQRDVVVGTPVAGRRRIEFEGLIGYFVNTLVLRGDLSGDPSFEQLLQRVRRVCLDAFEHQELPFDRLVAELSPQRDLSRNPLYQVSLALQNMPASVLALGELRAEQLPVDTATAKFDLTVALNDDGAALAGTLEYSTELFDASTIERMARHYRQLLRSIAARPEEPIGRLPLMDERERQQLLVTWNDTARAYPLDQNVHQLFEEQVRRSPEAPAVILEAEQLSYDALNRRANRLAHHLRALGVGPGVLVGLCMQRSPAMVVALLATLKAGGAYVPLDPQYPHERLAFMLSDTAAPVVITEQALLPQLPETAANTLCIDSDWHHVAQLPDTEPPALATQDDLAYVIYTSGSTGTPNGVAVSHRAVVSLVVNTDYVRLGPTDCVAQASSSSFDAATFEVWGALLNGALLVIVPRDVLLSGAALARQIEDFRINTMFVTTALFNEHAARSPGVFHRLDHLLVGGEAADPVAVQRVIDAAPPKRLLNAYGPTETTTFATWHEVPLQPGATHVSIPIGRPIANTRCHVLDASLEPVPVGAIGELHIGGSGLARGYLDRAELTAQRFIADPFRPGERLYRSGDLVRYRADGTIEYIGRIDQQVKIRGFRIELGEIESTLAREQGISQCAVVVRDDNPGDKRLVAYIVTSDPSSLPSSQEFRDRLAARLPPHMVPSAVVILDGMPLTANGKLDREALPAPTDVANEPKLTRADPTDDLERRLQDIWEETLGVRPIGLDDSFFELGGHSLLAIKLLDAVDRQFGQTLSLASLFDAPTIRDQAALLRLPGSQPESTCAIAVETRGDLAPLFFVSGFGGQILPFHAIAKELGPDQPLYVLDLNSLPDFDGGAIMLEGLAAQMIADMRKVEPHAPYRLVGYSLGGKFVYEIAQQLQRAGEPVDQLVLLDCPGPGFPRRLSFPARTIRHIKHASRLEPRAGSAYMADRLKNLRKYFGVREAPKVFTTPDAVEQTAIVREIEAKAKPIYAAWLSYVPAFYPGHLTLIRAAVREPWPGAIEDDPQMGWGSLVGQGVDVANLDCRHSEMLDARHAPALAALLAERPPGRLSARPDASAIRDVVCS